jgi:AraC family transcriptional regulator
VEALRLREVFGEQDAVLMALMEQLRSELRARRTASRLFVQAIAQSLAGPLVRIYPAPSSSGRAKRDGLAAFKLQKITQVIEAHLDEEIALARLAREAGSSEFHFSRLFKKTTGFSPSQYLIRQRIARARRLLQETAKSMIEIRLEVGYSSLSHFAQIFRRQAASRPRSIAVGSDRNVRVERE